MTKSKNADSLMGERVARNQVKECQVSGCSRLRTGVSSYCHQHQQSRKRYGTPTGRRLRPKEYRQETTDVLAFIAEHQGHEAIQAALKAIDYTLHTAPRLGRKSPAKDDCLRLSARGVTAEEVLVNAAAVWLFHRRNPQTMDDGLPLTYALGISALTLAKREQRAGISDPNKLRYKPIGSIARKEMGEFLRYQVGPAIGGIVAALEKRDADRRKWNEALRSPFVSADDPEQLKLGTAGLGIDEAGDPRH